MINMSKNVMKEERMKILELLSKGVISSDEAEKLLTALDRAETSFAESIVPTKKPPFRMLKIFVDSNDGDVVKIQVPIEFAKLLKSSKFNVNFTDNDIDIDSIIEMVNSGVMGEIVNVVSSDGDTVRIVVE
ncbi:MAG: hypothetical protein EA375_05905 [Acholeplasmataceae bacterium]|nr:MAG: hypothetical protein EA375_05905 [Acholeplasmataceae bacterium]